MTPLQNNKAALNLDKYYYIENFEKLLKKVLESHAPSLSEADELFVRQYFNLDLNAKILLVRIANSKRFYFSEREIRKYAKDCDVAKAIDHLMNLNFLKWVSTSNELAPPLIQSMGEISDSSHSLFKELTQQLGEALVHGQPQTQQFEFDLSSSSYFVATFKIFSSYLEFLHFGDTTSNSTQFALAQLNLASDVSRGQVMGLSRLDWLFFKSVGVMAEFPQLQQTLFQLCHLHSDSLAQKLSSFTCAFLIKTLWFLKPGKAASENTNHNRSSLIHLVFSTGLSDFYAPAIRHLKRTKDERLNEFLKKLPNIDLPPEITQFLQGEDPTSTISRRTIHLPHGALADLEASLAQLLSTSGIETYYTENRLWKMLFALTFWDIYFSKDAQGRLSFIAPTREFFQSNEAQFEQILAKLTTPQTHQRHVLKNFAANYKKPQKFFRWTQKYMEPMIKLIEFSPPGAVPTVLRRMAKDFKFYCSGFPDLISITAAKNKISFTEIKAEGDKISPKQNLRLFELQSLGYDCEVVDVRWDQDDGQTYVVLDVETTGGLQGRNRVTEIGAVKIQNGHVIDNYQTLINPCIPIPRAITRLTGIANEMVASAPTFTEIAFQLREFLKGSIFVAHHVRFDYGFIQKEFALLGEEFFAPTACTVVLARRKFKGLESYSLKNLCHQLDISLETHHRAHCDAVAASQIFIKCMSN